MNKQKIKAFQKSVRSWHRHHAPKLPWRNTKNPWHMLVSEVMLQQTQIPRVLQMYPRFLTSFPTPRALAKAPLRNVLAVWQGMGYNRRAKYLQEAARIIESTHAGVIPKDKEQLDALPGIGTYSACAITCFAYKKCEPFIETNIRRAVIHEFFADKKMVDDKEVLKILETVEPTRNRREWYWALMDYGRDGLKGMLNANRQSRHYTKQSKFEGSQRQLRAEILRILLKNKRATPKDIELSLKKNPTTTSRSETYLPILQDLVQERLIKQTGNIFRI